MVSMHHLKKNVCCGLNSHVVDDVTYPQKVKVIMCLLFLLLLLLYFLIPLLVKIPRVKNES